MSLTHPLCDNRQMDSLEPSSRLVRMLMKFAYIPKSVMNHRIPNIIEQVYHEVRDKSFPMITLQLFHVLRVLGLDKKMLPQSQRPFYSLVNLG
jgi:hypothetical protein